MRCIPIQYKVDINPSYECAEEEKGYDGNKKKNTMRRTAQ